MNLEDRATLGRICMAYNLIVIGEPDPDMPLSCPWPRPLPQKGPKPPAGKRQKVK